MKQLLTVHRRIALQGPATPLEWGLFLLLLPWSVVYGVIGWLRNRSYDLGLMPSSAAAVPVISVGNLAVGGTGKTPAVDWLVKELIKLGKRPAVVSRGYGGHFSGDVGVVSSGSGPLLDARVAGDEPILIARRNPQVPVLIARKRSDGVRTAVERFGVDIVILDDGFQHRAMQRDLDLVLLDATRPLGNRWPLPAGLLREFPAALHRADLLLLTRASDSAPFEFAGKPVFRSRHQLTDGAVSLSGEVVPLTELQEKKLFAFAGIADPDGFFAALRNIGLQLEGQLALGDHCAYDNRQLAELRTAAESCDALVTTEKDAVKLRDDSFTLPCYQLPMNMQVENAAALLAAVRQKLWSE